MRFCLVDSYLDTGDKCAKLIKYITSRFKGGYNLSHIKDKDERWALALLEQIIQRSNQDRDALPGSAVKHVKEARKIIKKRQKPRMK